MIIEETQTELFSCCSGVSHINIQLLRLRSDPVSAEPHQNSERSHDAAGGGVQEH